MTNQKPLIWRSLSDEDLADALRQAGCELGRLSSDDQITLIHKIREALKAHHTVMVVISTTVDIVSLDD